MWEMADGHSPPGSVEWFKEFVMLSKHDEPGQPRFHSSFGGSIVSHFRYMYSYKFVFSFKKRILE